MSKNMDLPDINVWLSISVEDHPHHDRAVEYWKNERSDQIGFCRVTMLGFVRLLCNKHVMADDPMTIQEAYGAYLTLLESSSIVFLSEQSNVDNLLSDLVKNSESISRIWTDIYLAAFAMTSNLRIVSFDSDFQQFNKLNFLHLRN